MTSSHGVRADRLGDDVVVAHARTVVVLLYRDLGRVEALREVARFFRFEGGGKGGALHHVAAGGELGARVAVVGLTAASRKAGL